MFGFDLVFPWINLGMALLTYITRRIAHTLDINFYNFYLDNA